MWQGRRRCTLRCRHRGRRGGGRRAASDGSGEDVPEVDGDRQSRHAVLLDGLRQAHALEDREVEQDFA